MDECKPLIGGVGGGRSGNWQDMHGWEKREAMEAAFAARRAGTLVGRCRLTQRNPS